MMRLMLKMLADDVRPTWARPRRNGPARAADAGATASSRASCSAFFTANASQSLLKYA